ncbi:hypothetical protein [Halopiger djelfimassiliensis]|uniref:hypothetical protein n=1 Tax=Halopiger djelfimassiliensis TaxID=1293047 RepID=UPI0012B5AD62|nr:hypothetical protein [Halopiger djelfimassiliensis]
MDGNIHRRKLLKVTSASAVGIGSLVAATGTSAAGDYMPCCGGGSGGSDGDGVSFEEKGTSNDVAETEVTARNGGVIAEPASTVSAAGDSFPNSADSFKLGMTWQIPYQSPDNSSYTTYLRDVSIEVEPVSAPFGETPALLDSAASENGNQNTRDSGSDLFQFALNTAYNATAGNVIPLPSPFGLGSFNDDNVSIKTSSCDGENRGCLTADWADIGEELYGLETWINFRRASDGYPPSGTYKHDVTFEVDISTTNPNQTTETVSHTHRVEYEVRD